MSDTSTLVTVTRAGQVTGISERTIRRWISAGRLPVTHSERGRLVDLAAVRCLAGHHAGQPDNDRQPDRHVPDLDRQGDPGVPVEITPDGVISSVEGLGELVALVCDKDQQLARLQDERAELYGRLGFLQARVQDLEQQVKLLSAPPVTPIGVTPDVSENSNMHDVKHGLQAPESNTLDLPDVNPGKHPADPAPTSTTNHPTPVPNGQDSGAERPARRRWWEFWR